jgi:hypothetical protein
MAEHKYLYFAHKINLTFDKILKKINSKSNKKLKSKLSTIAINLWSPYLQWGRSTFLEYTNELTQVEREKKKKIHNRYLSLFGRNFSINHLFLEVKDLKKIEVHGFAKQLRGPEIVDANKIQIHFPDIDETKDKFLIKLLPKHKVTDWVTQLSHDKYEVLYKSLIMQQLKDCRKSAKENYPSSFADYLYNFIKHNAISTSIGLHEIDDKWLSRIQMTLIASKIWGPFWRSELININNPIANLLNLKASLTVTSNEDIYRDNNIITQIDTLTLEISNEIKRVLDSLGILKHDNSYDSLTENLSMNFSIELGARLIGEDHEGKPLTFRGILSQGLDSIGEISSFAEVIHEINPEDFKCSDKNSDYWSLWKAYFKSNDLYLSKDNICLHFEMESKNEKSNEIIVVPRHVLKIPGSVESFLERLDSPNIGLLLQAFETNQFVALHYKKLDNKIERRIQLKGQNYEETDTHTDWSHVRVILENVYKYILQNSMDAFFSDVCKNIEKLSQPQMINLFDGIVEVGRRNLGCLVFIGNLEEKVEKIFLKEKNGTRGEVSRLGISLNIVSVIPNHFSEDFRNAFALEAGMDGETIVSCNAFNHHQIGSIWGRKFVHLPSSASALLKHNEPSISNNYIESWEQAKKSLFSFTKKKTEKDISFRLISDMQRSELISLGTRHRKASMISMAFTSVLAITCSSSGNIKIWVKGVPIIDVKPDTKKILDYFPTTKI